MQRKRKSLQRSVAIQSTDLFESDVEATQQTARLCKKTGFRNLLEQSVTIISEENDEGNDEEEPSSEGKKSRGAQAALDKNQALQNPRFKDKLQCLEPSLTRKHSSGDDLSEKIGTSDMMRILDKALPGTSGMMSTAYSSYSVYSQMNDSCLGAHEGSLAVVYNYGDKSFDTSRSFNLLHFGSQSSRRFSDETVILIEDYQSYDYTNAARRQDYDFASRRTTTTCCNISKRCSVSVLMRPVHLELEGIDEKDESLLCRICHEGEELEPLIQPCLCKGSVGNVHAQCLKIWLEQSNTNRCELCNYPYAIRQTRKYSKCYSVKVFFKTVVDRRAIAYDLISFFVITPLTLVGVEMCIQASLFSSSSENMTDANYQMGNITKAGMIMLSGTILVAYGVWLYTLISYHFKSWKKWYSNCYDVEVIPVRLTSEERLEAARRLSEEMNRRQMSREQRSALLTVLHSPNQNNHSFYHRRHSVNAAPPALQPLR